MLSGAFRLGPRARQPPSRWRRNSLSVRAHASGANSAVNGAGFEGDSQHVIARRESNMRLLLLNRPAALNALSVNMIHLMTPQLKVWDESDATKSILLTSIEGSRSFCAGGDVRAMLPAKSKKAADLAMAMKFIESEYRLNHLTGTLKKPYISLMNGIAMGGGIGISVHGPFRIATENTLFSMPETNIGLFPDVGASFFLPRLDGELGTFLGLTSHRLQGVEVFLSGIATHYIPSKRIHALLEILADLESDDLTDVNMALEKFSEPLSQDVWRKWSLGGEVANAINRTFKFNTVEEIVDALKKEDSEWANKTLKELEAVSPTSLKVTLEQLRRGKTLDFASCFRQEYRMVQGFLQGTDFFEGVTARLVEKRPPKWSHTLNDLPNILHADILRTYFDPFPPAPSKRAPNSTLPRERLDFLTPLTYFEYPHHTLSGLPTDRDVESVISGRFRRGSGQSITLTKKQDVVNTFLSRWGGYDPGLVGTDAAKLPRVSNIDHGHGKGKKGLREKVVSILERRVPTLQ
ncbi:ClpP/crotonase-like domain-containing protein [Chytriomyces sp. MP71]|nr:ClpP/crotonase-like domain-containing protein [Chytriomyces sp. MP71]